MPAIDKKQVLFNQFISHCNFACKKVAHLFFNVFTWYPQVEFRALAIYNYLTMTWFHLLKATTFRGTCDSLFLRMVVAALSEQSLVLFLDLTIHNDACSWHSK